LELTSSIARLKPQKTEDCHYEDPFEEVVRSKEADKSIQAPPAVGEAVNELRDARIEIEQLCLPDLECVRDFLPPSRFSRPLCFLQQSWLQKFLNFSEKLK
jgi:hypothetical protein